MRATTEGFANRPALMAATGERVEKNPLVWLAPARHAPGSIIVPTSTIAAAETFVAAGKAWFEDGENPYKLLLNLADIGLEAVQQKYDLIAKGAEEKIAKIIGETGEISSQMLKDAIAVKDDALRKLVGERLPATSLTAMSDDGLNMAVKLKREADLAARLGRKAPDAAAKAARKGMARVLETSLPMSYFRKWSSLLGKITLALDFGPAMVNFIRARNEKEQRRALQALRATAFGKVIGAAATWAVAGLATWAICVVLAATPPGWVALGVGAGAGLAGIIAGVKAEQWLLRP